MSGYSIKWRCSPWGASMIMGYVGNRLSYIILDLVFLAGKYKLFRQYEGGVWYDMGDCRDFIEALDEAEWWEGNRKRKGNK
jgi:hypothetical protein